MRILDSGIIVNVRGAHQLFHNLECLAHRAHHVGVSEIEADSNIVQNALHGSFPSIDREWKVHSEYFPAERRTPSGLAKARRCSMEVIADSNFFSLNSHWATPGVAPESETESAPRSRAPASLIHRLHQRRAIRGSQVDRRRSRAPPLIVGIKRRVYGVQRHSAAAKPLRNLLHMSLAVGIVEVLPRRKKSRSPAPHYDSDHPEFPDAAVLSHINRLIPLSTCPVLNQELPIEKVNDFQRPSMRILVPRILVPAFPSTPGPFRLLL